MNKIDIKAWVVAVERGVGRVAKTVRQSQGIAPGEMEIYTNPGLGTEIKGMGKGFAVNIFENDPGPPFQVNQHLITQGIGKF